MGAGEDRNSGSAMGAMTMDLQSDDVTSSRAQKASQLRWDRKRKRFTKDTSADGQKVKMVKMEGGGLMPASYDSGRFSAWARKRPRQSLISGNDDNGSTSRESRAPSRRHAHVCAGSAQQSIRPADGFQLSANQPSAEQSPSLRSANAIRKARAEAQKVSSIRIQS